MARLKKNSTVKTILGESVQVINMLGEGGQGIVYEVKWRGGNYALKETSVDKLVLLPKCLY